MTLFTTPLPHEGHMTLFTTPYRMRGTYFKHNSTAVFTKTCPRPGPAQKQHISSPCDQNGEKKRHAVV